MIRSPGDSRIDKAAANDVPFNCSGETCMNLHSKLNTANVRVLGPNSLVQGICEHRVRRYSSHALEVYRLPAIVA